MYRLLPKVYYLTLYRQPAGKRIPGTMAWSPQRKRKYKIKGLKKSRRHYSRCQFVDKTMID